MSESDLLSVHTKEYLDSLKKSRTVAFIAGLDGLAFMPNFILQKKILVPMRYATGGTILGAVLALRHGWAINLAGGYHHAKANCGGGLCFYADVPIAVKKLQKQHPGLSVLIVDLDAHQGNGNAAVFRGDPNVHIFDIYNGTVYPWDFEAGRHAEFSYPLPSHVEDPEFLALVREELPKAIEKTKPGLIVFVAGTDGIKGDTVGKWSLSEDGIIQRDELVFLNALKYKVPILMVLSGGYTEQSAAIISKSIRNLMDNILPYRK
ncbi:MAG: histone deacetylase family protein [Endomicrobiales bacterium]